MNMENIGKSIKEIFQDKYIIPLYQRNFAWEEPELEKLLQDIYESYSSNKQQYFLGSLVVIRRKNTNIYEVIDGQQRLTALSLIIKALGDYDGITPNLVLSYDSRPEVENFLQRYYSTKNFDEQEGVIHASTQRMREALGIIRDAQLDANPDSEYQGITRIGNADWSKKSEFQKYLYENVKLVRVEIPDDTDVAAYFEIMNNRGTQLQDHEIIKSRLMEKIQEGGTYDLDGQTLFAEIWDACSQMDSHVQSNFTSDIRKILFAEEYSEFNWDWNKCKSIIKGRVKSVEREKNALSLADVLKNISTYLIEDPNTSKTNEDEDEDETETNYYSIIDFPNFLMHVFKVYYNELYNIDVTDNSKKTDIPLHDKYLISVFNILDKKIDPIDFIENLLWCRVVFDRYIVKSENPEKMEWSLVHAYKSGNGLKFKNTFQEDTLHKKCIKLTSMLQVTFRSRYYKNFLQNILVYFHDKKSEIIDGNDYIMDIHTYVLKHLASLISTKDEEWNCKGVDTPHFILNLIDYLYWLRSLKDETLKIEDFDFKNLNSVEHHRARNLVEETDNWINELGNLYLLAKNENSHLNDRYVAQKIADYFDASGNLIKEKNIGPNRQIMYKESKEHNDGADWKKEDIHRHTLELMDMLKNAEKILKS